MAHASSRAAAGSPHWRASLVAVCIAQATAIVGFDFTLPFVPLYLQHDLGVHGLGQTALWSGLIGFGPAIPATIFGPIWGRLADRVGYRFMLLRAMTSAAVLLALMGAASSPWMLLVLRMVQGSLTGTVFAAQALVAASVPEEETGRSMGLLQMSVSLGATLGPVGGGAAAVLLGYRAPFVGAGVLLGLATAVVYLFVREPERRTVERQAREKRPSIRAVLFIPAFAAVVFLTLAVQLAATSLLPIIPLFVQDLLHSSREVAAYTGWVMAMSGIASAAGAYLAGRLQRHLPVKPLLMISIALAALLLFPQAYAGNFVVFLALRSVASLAFGSVFGLVGVWAATASPPDSKGTAFGLMGAASSMGFGAGPLLGGIAAAGLGIRPVFVLAAIVLGAIPFTVLLGTVIVPRLRDLVAGSARLGRTALGRR
ncbi:MAG TPA: MFS transporter [Chloroflexota bacterium]|nr:MFS transporter [Chloroflexota bacterium]